MTSFFFEKMSIYQMHNSEPPVSDHSTFKKNWFSMRKVVSSATRPHSKHLPCTCCFLPQKTCDCFIKVILQHLASPSCVSTGVKNIVVTSTVWHHCPGVCQSDRGLVHCYVCNRTANVSRVDEANDTWTLLWNGFCSHDPLKWSWGPRGPRNTFWKLPKRVFLARGSPLM